MMPQLRSSSLASFAWRRNVVGRKAGPGVGEGGLMMPQLRSSSLASFAWRRNVVGWKAGPGVGEAARR